MKQVTFLVEDWADCWRDMAALWPEHHKEIALHHAEVPLDPDLEQYSFMQAHGQLAVLVGRSEGRIVGYYISIIKPHLHYKSTLHAFTDVYYIAPEFRQGTTGWRMLNEMKTLWKARGVKKAFTATKLHLDISPLLKRQGWLPAESTHCILL